MSRAGILVIAHREPEPMSSLPIRRILCLWLPDLPTDRVERSTAPSSRAPLVLVTRAEGTMRVSAVNRAARALSIAPGMALAAARAMVPGIDVREHECAADAALLEAIGDWADRYSPLVGRAPPDTLLIDITGAAHLAGGEAPLMRDLVDRMTRQGFTAHAAIAGTPGAAHALARSAASARAGGLLIERDEDIAEALAPLPVAALRIGSQTAAGLVRVGLKQIGDLMRRPRAPLAARFGPRLLQRLDQALGREEEAISPRQPVPPAVVETPLAEPIVREEDVGEVARRLAMRLADMLADRGEGACAVRLDVFRVDGIRRSLEVGFAAPCRDGGQIHSLLRHRFGALADGIDAGFGFDFVRLAATRVAGKAAQAMSLDGLQAGCAADFAQSLNGLVERLSAALGTERVLRIAEADTHIPERAAQLRPALAHATRGTPRPPPPEPRPLRLLYPPEPIEVVAEVPDGPPLRFRWRRALHRVAAADGPERILPEWWREPSGARPRDYYRVEDEAGRRLWVYRDGLYGPHTDGEDQPGPRWFVHGLFG